MGVGPTMCLPARVAIMRTLGELTAVQGDADGD